MTDKLQDVVERFIHQNEVVYIDRCNADGSAITGIDVDDLRAFLAQYVLCEKEPVGHAVPSRKGDAIVMTVAALRVPGNGTTPLYMQAKE